MLEFLLRSGALVFGRRIMIGKSWWQALPPAHNQSKQSRVACRSCLQPRRAMHVPLQNQQRHGLRVSPTNKWLTWCRLAPKKSREIDDATSLRPSHIPHNGIDGLPTTTIPPTNRSPILVCVTLDVRLCAMNRY